MVTHAALQVVATPIGNLGDISARAQQVLCSADIVCCEDTRHSRPLLQHLGSQATLWSCHAHNERDRALEVIAALQAGKRVALISDAGAPTLSDPGGRVVEAVVAAGLAVEVIPGPTALVAALMGAGLDTNAFAFLGFLPRKGAERRQRAQRAIDAGLALVVYENPQRLADTLDDLFAWCGPRRVVVGRELTKMHETFHRGVLGESLMPALVERGECVVVVEGGSVVETVPYQDDVSLPLKERAKRLAAHAGISTRDAYQQLVEAAQPHAAIDDVRAAQAALVQAADAMRRALQAQAVADHPDAPPAAGQLVSLLESPMTLSAPVEGKALLTSLLRAAHDVDALLEALDP
jgi:16S rRNA (cytidine1402-2'-O)-methyltransferase